ALGANGLNVPMVYLMGVDTIMSLYEALTDGARGGPIALAILEYENTAELAQWFIEAPPAALGPILMTLTAAPQRFRATPPAARAPGGQTVRSFTRADCRTLQQRAVVRVLDWIAETARKTAIHLESSREQFARACIMMNRFGIEGYEPATSYRSN